MIGSRLWRARRLRMVIREMCPNISFSDITLPDRDRVQRIMESPVSENELFAAFHTVRCFSATKAKGADQS